MALSKNLAILGCGLGFVLAVQAGPAHAQDLSRGKELFELCAQCHGPTGGGKQLFLAPAIAGLDAWYVQEQLQKFKQGLRGLHPEDVGGLRMYPMSLALRSEEDIQHVAAYIASLPRARPEPVVEGGNAKRGAGLFAPCIACHGPDASGNQALKAPNLNGASDWYLVSTLEKYKSGVRGSNAANTNAAIMRGMASTLANEQAVKDVVAHIMTLAK